MTAVTATRTRSVEATVVVARVLLGAGTAAGALVLAAELLGQAAAFPVTFLLSALLQLVVLVVGFAVLRRIRPIHSPPFGVSAVGVLWGGLAATGGALLANDALGGVWAKAVSPAFDAAWGAALTAPLNEEVLKVAGVGLLALAFPLVLRGPVDGLVLGALTGLGFQVVENVLYGLRTVEAAGGVGEVGAAIETFVVRVGVTGLGSHWAMTAVAGAGVGFMVAHRVAAGVFLIVLAMAMHWLFDSPLLSFTGGVAVKVAVNFLIFLVLYFTLRRTYRRHARRALHADESTTLLTRHARRKARRHVPAGPERARVIAYQRSRLATLDE
ncbi:PrsW family intramembrane metalloprotease [Actinomadura flavalba]|uniref:PrsW family intramembrane metalloprotease n=1 Tax=Actinomadura flavalba TaxID=1120938 RepID=UPI000375A297|nr:PrsW family intramembrane metalloprotease [Actinomadura flavalba]